MKFYILIFICLITYHYIPQKRTYLPAPKFQLHLSPNQLSPTNYALYQGLVTGNKKAIPHKIKHSFKRYGLLHLLTPSGIHLSSLMFIFGFSNILEIISLIALLGVLLNFNSYHSLERVIIFRILYRASKVYLKRDINIEIVFIFTIIISVLVGHFSQNPLSFFYSFIFWGTVLIFRKQKGKMLIHLNFVLFLTASLSNDLISPLSLFINPIMTFVIASCFPLLAFNALFSKLINFNFLLEHILNFLVSLLELISRYDPFPAINFATITLLCFYFLFARGNIKTAVLLLCLSTAPPNIKKLTVSNKLYNLGDPSEYLGRKASYYLFIDQKCTLKDIQIRCKSKNSHFGGIIF